MEGCGSHYSYGTRWSLFAWSGNAETLLGFDELKFLMEKENAILFPLILVKNCIPIVLDPYRS